MKNRRTTLIAFVLIAALCVGIGYAALTDTLTIGGNVSASANELDAAVKFCEIRNISKPTHANAVDPTITFNNDSVSVSVPAGLLINEGDILSFDAVVEYTGNVGNVTIKRDRITQGSLFAITTDSDSYTIQDPGSNGPAHVLIHVVIKAGDMSTVADGYSEDFTISFTVTSDAV